MKILTKEWAKKHEQLRFLNYLKEYDEQNERYKDIKTKSKLDFCKEIQSDEELAKLVLGTTLFDKLYQAEKDRLKNLINSLPIKIINRIKNIKTLVLGYACKEDKELLSSYSKELLVDVERLVKVANKSTEIAEDYLNEDFVLDDFVGELVFEEYSNDKNYYLSTSSGTICIQNFEFLEHEDFKINKWEDDNPLTLWTAIHSAELHYISLNCYELHLLLVDGDKYANKKFWYFTIKGTNVKKL